MRLFASLARGTSVSQTILSVSSRYIGVPAGKVDGGHGTCAAAGVGANTVPNSSVEASAVPSSRDFGWAVRSWGAGSGRRGWAWRAIPARRKVRADGPRLRSCRRATTPPKLATVLLPPADRSPA
jgi:hypothetical protein